MTTPAELAYRVRQLEVAARRAAAGTLAGRWRSAFRGRGLAADDVRAYAAGDDVRAIDWNVTARTGVLHVKRFAEERELTVAVLLDRSASMDFGSGARTKLEAAAEAAALLALAAGAAGDHAALLPFAAAPLPLLPPRRGRRHALTVAAAALAGGPEPGGTDVAAALDRFRAALRRRAVGFLVSDLLSPPAAWEAALAAAARRHDVTAVVVDDRAERDLPRAGLLLAVDPETGARVAVDLASSRVRARLARAREEATAERDRALARCGVPALRIDASATDPLAPLLAYLDARAARGRRGARARGRR